MVHAPVTYFDRLCDKLYRVLWDVLIIYGINTITISHHWSTPEQRPSPTLSTSLCLMLVCVLHPALTNAFISAIHLAHCFPWPLWCMGCHIATLIVFVINSVDDITSLSLPVILNCLSSNPWCLPFMFNVMKSQCHGVGNKGWKVPVRRNIFFLVKLVLIREYTWQH